MLNWESSSNGDLFTGRLGALVEDDQGVLVFLESGDVGFVGLGGSVDSSWVDSNANGSGVFWRVADGLQFRDGETSTSSDLSVVFDSWASDDRSQQVDWLWSNLGGLGGSGRSSGGLLTGLVQVDSDSFLPVLSEVVLKNWEVLVDSCMRGGGGRGEKGVVLVVCSLWEALVVTGAF